MQWRSLTIALGVLTWLGCGSTPPAGTDPEICDNQQDDNRDGKVDCLDPKCFDNPVCAVKMREECSNSVDDDGDGKTDCADAQCEGEPCGSGCLCIGGVPTTSSGGGSAGTGGGASGTGGGTSGTGGGSSGTGGGSSGTGGGTSGTGGGTSGTGGGTSGTGGGSSGTGGGSSGTGGGSSGTGGGSSGTGGGSSGTGGGSSTGGGSAARELNCANGMDDEGDGATDCDDSDCIGVTCGMGCTCALRRKTEIACDDGMDNDADGNRDCADSDCVGAGTEICNDGIDNTCDRAIDCGDSKCASSGACSNVQDGLPCLSSTQCASGRCQTEGSTGFPNGMCTNASACTVGSTTGCHGGLCINYVGVPTCLARCTGTGLGATGRCRAGFACVDQDTDTMNDNNTCRALCSNDLECSGGGTGYGCNPWSKLCQNVDRGLGRYGSACTSHSQCETGICLTGALNPNGYCAGVCRADTRSCAAGGGCYVSSSYLDNVGTCFQACTGAGTGSVCRVSDNYKCWSLGSGAPLACLCVGPGGNCLLGGNSDCCSGICQLGTCRCVPSGFSCGGDRECCSGTCAGGTCAL